MDLRRKLTNNKNLYEGYIPYQDNHRDTYYTEFVKQFAPAYPKEDNILRILTNEDFIVNNDSFYIVFLGDSVTTKYANCFKFHFVQNFLVNWDEYKNINLAAADVDGNGKVNNLDKVILTRHLANWDEYAVLPYVG